MGENLRQHWKRDLIAAIVGALAGFVGSEQYSGGPYGGPYDGTVIARVSREHERITERLEGLERGYGDRLARIEELLKVVHDEVRRQRDRQERGAQP